MEGRMVSPKERGRGFELRRAQILRAARDCFSKYGFHGTSIAALAKSSGMSIGHIYHYFPKKEAIVAAIAKEALSEILEVHADILSRADMLEGLLSHAVDTAVQFSYPENSRLRLEILSEAARDPCLGRIVNDIDKQVRASAFKVLKCILESRGMQLSHAEIDARFEILSALVSGFLTRSVKTSNVDKFTFRESLYHALRLVLVSEAPERLNRVMQNPVNDPESR